MAFARDGATMRWSPFRFLALALLALTGCGTVHNLKDSPNGPMFCCTGCCYPFGGVVRSGAVAVLGTPGGLGAAILGDIAICQGNFGPGFDLVGQGMGMTALGLVAIADVPLSLAGDILTLPVVYARSHEYWWATWWGKESMGWPATDLIRPPEEGNKQLEGEVEPTELPQSIRPAPLVQLAD
jgi:uncharacterized protein YceK